MTLAVPRKKPLSVINAQGQGRFPHSDDEVTYAPVLDLGRPTGQLKPNPADPATGRHDPHAEADGHNERAVEYPCALTSIPGPAVLGHQCRGSHPQKGQAPEYAIEDQTRRRDRAHESHFRQMADHRSVGDTDQRRRQSLRGYWGRRG